MVVSDLWRRNVATNGSKTSAAGRILLMRGRRFMVSSAVEWKVTYVDGVWCVNSGGLKRIFPAESGTTPASAVNDKSRARWGLRRAYEYSFLGWFT